MVQFDEVIDEAAGGSSAGGAITGLAARIVLSPVNGEVKVSWHRDAIHVNPAEGWKRNRVYHLEVLPGPDGLTLLRRLRQAGGRRYNLKFVAPHCR